MNTKFTIKTKLLLNIIITLILIYLKNLKYFNSSLFYDIANKLITYTFLQIGFTLFVVLIGLNIYIKGFKNIINLRPDINSLIFISSLLAIIYSIIQSIKVLFFDNITSANNYIFDIVAIILTVFILSEYIILFLNEKAEFLNQKYINILPQKATILIDGQTKTVPITELKTGHIIVVKQSEIISIDGEIIKGNSYIDESILTGLNINSLKKEGDKVFAGTINKNDILYIKAEKTGKYTTLAKTKEYMKKAVNTTPIILTKTKKSAEVFINIVAILILILFFVWWIISKDIYLALIILLNSSIIVCSIKILYILQVAIKIILGKSLQLGICFKNAQAIENLSKIKSISFSRKSLIDCKVYVTDIYATEKFSLLQVLLYCASAEQNVNNHIAKAIINEAKDRKIELFDANDFYYKKGQGIQAIINNKNVKAGDINFFKIDEKIKDKTEKYNNQGKEAVIVSIDGEIAGIIALKNNIKQDTKIVINKIKNKNIKTYIQEGNILARYTAQKCDINITEKKEIKNSAVITVDNQNKFINIKGNDIDINILGNTLKGVLDAILFSKKTLNNIKQNIFLTFLITIIGILLAMGLFNILFNIMLNTVIAIFITVFCFITISINISRLNLLKSNFE